MRTKTHDLQTPVADLDVGGSFVRRTTMETTRGAMLALESTTIAAYGRNKRVNFGLLLQFLNLP
jgi:hypothetical protein